MSLVLEPGLYALVLGGLQVLILIYGSGVLDMTVSELVRGKVHGYLLVKKICGFQASQFVTFVPGGESLIIAVVNTMASSFITITCNAHNE